MRRIALAAPPHLRWRAPADLVSGELAILRRVPFSRNGWVQSAERAGRAQAHAAAHRTAMSACRPAVDDRLPLMATIPAAMPPDSFMAARGKRERIDPHVPLGVPLAHELPVRRGQRGGPRHELVRADGAPVSPERSLRDGRRPGMRALLRASPPHSLVAPGVTSRGVSSPFFVGCHSAASAEKRPASDVAAVATLPAHAGHPWPRRAL